MLRILGNSHSFREETVHHFRIPSDPALRVSRSYGYGWIVIALMLLLYPGVQLQEIVTDYGGLLMREMTGVEVCQMETFKASCASDEVLIIQTAQLGRLQLGKCVKDETHEVGCWLDVLAEMDRFCSGRHECQVKVDDNSFKRTTPCHTDLKNHLWASYQCIKVVLPSDKCNVPSRRSGMLSSQVTENTGCGMTETPWIVQAGSGQRINVVLYDFSVEASALVQHPPSSIPTDVEPIGGGGGRPQVYRKTCRVYATIREVGPTGRSKTVCGEEERIGNVFLSTTDRIELRFLAARSGLHRGTNQQNDQVAHFLLQYSVIGCSDPVLWKDMVLKRTPPTSDEATLECDQTNLSWRLNCKDGEWKGNFGNCSTDKPLVLPLGMPYAVSTIIIIIIALTISSLILTIGIICIKRRMKTEQEIRCLQAELNPDHYDGDYSLGAMSPDKLTLDSNNPSAAGLIMPDGSGNEYARMRLQHAMTDYAGGSQSYATDGSIYRFPVVEHVYESPDSLRRDESRSSAFRPHYTHRLLAADEGLLSRPSPSGPGSSFSPGAATRNGPVHAQMGICGAPVKQDSKSSKTAGNYSL